MTVARARGECKPLPGWLRFCFYGMHGFLDEIVFTSLFDFYHTKDWSLKGHSSIYSFFIYGLCSFLVEHLYKWLYYKHGVPRYVRIPIYIAITYSWEFTTGFILRQFDACPWDYTHYDYDFMGLITLEYAPGWLLLAYWQDVVAEFLINLRISCTCFPAGDVASAEEMSGEIEPEDKPQKRLKSHIKSSVKSSG
ncbi:transmembrane protein 229A [Lingula anatina]|uniref:Transmembrane protein 229A n=1 Tax=Lingula anatina TaxID=7574 RepID=A0A1S3H1W1_LINAN|nr:transmembrane protein 229A [Lingula anatina]|eukprot:XP_013380008.1 transmembrane protein 229A [Lingula anatina]